VCRFSSVKLEKDFVGQCGELIVGQVIVSFRQLFSQAIEGGRTRRDVCRRA
jgi:hypothetical protein